MLSAAIHSSLFLQVMNFAPVVVKWISLQFPTLSRKTTHSDTHTSLLLHMHLKLIIYLMEQFGSENVILSNYFKCASEDPQVRLSFFPLCLQIPHIQSFSIIQKKYLIFIPKWKLFHNVVWKKGKMGAGDKEEWWDWRPRGTEKWWFVYVWEMWMTAYVSMCLFESICKWEREKMEKNQPRGKEAERSEVEVKASTHTNTSHPWKQFLLVLMHPGKKVTISKWLCEWWNWMQQ